MPNSADGSEEREQQLDAIVAEYDRVEEAGEEFNQADFIDQHPCFTKELQEFFSNIGILGVAVSNVASFPP